MKAHGHRDGRGVAMTVQLFQEDLLDELSTVVLVHGVLILVAILIHLIVVDISVLISLLRRIVRLLPPGSRLTDRRAMRVVAMP